ncbi:hypothetical protein [Acinetobacter soli]|uniref:hypothetical protein n=1 Tax=Acinetobacter soli TaxID=487316 RepID=UPI001250A321|nr:hypothetical protein [Acinetobacter soli]
MKKQLITCLFLLGVANGHADTNTEAFQIAEQAIDDWIACVDVNTKFYNLSGESTENIAIAVMGKCRPEQESFNIATEQHLLSNTSKSVSVRNYARLKARESTNEFASQLRDRIFQKLIEEKAVKGLSR